MKTILIFITLILASTLASSKELTKELVIEQYVELPTAYKNYVLSGEMSELENAIKANTENTNFINLINENRNKPTKQNLDRIANFLKRNPEPLQVGPGSEVPDININMSTGPVKCQGDFAKCTKAANKDFEIKDNGKKSVAYSLSGFRHVGIILWRDKNKEIQKICNFVLLTTDLGLTAKHCVINSNPKDEIKTEWLIMTKESIIKSDSLLEFSGCDSSTAPSKECTYIKLAPVGAPEINSSADLAIVKFDNEKIDPKLDIDVFPTLDFSMDELKEVTLIGNGMSNVTGFDQRRPLVGWFSGRILNFNSRILLTQSFRETKPAPGDSGSPVYRGEYYGRDCEKTLPFDKGCIPYLLTAIVSGGDMPNINSTNKAAQSGTKCVRISAFKNWICTYANTAKGCGLPSFSSIGF